MVVDEAAEWASSIATVRPRDQHCTSARSHAPTGPPPEMTTSKFRPLFLGPISLSIRRESSNPPLPLVHSGCTQSGAFIPCRATSIALAISCSVPPMSPGGDSASSA